jgi:ParB-like chromosome segregation protein Spo0J
MKELKQSETRIIKRSQINLNPINPKRHSDERIRLQKKNLQKVGFLGGIVWNELSGNLIDGHRRIKAMDMYYKYDGTSDTDYKVKVEVVNLDEKKEKEQLTYMAVGNTKPDLDLLASYLPDIDYSEVGLSPDELNDILAISEVDANSLSESLDDLLLPTDFDSIKNPIPEDAALPYEEKKEHMKAVKQQVKESAFQHR